MPSGAQRVRLVAHGMRLPRGSKTHGREPRSRRRMSRSRQRTLGRAELRGGLSLVKRRSQQPSMPETCERARRLACGPNRAPTSSMKTSMIIALCNDAQTDNTSLSSCFHSRKDRQPIRYPKAKPSCPPTKHVLLLGRTYFGCPERAGGGVVAFYGARGSPGRMGAFSGFVRTF